MAGMIAALFGGRSRPPDPNPLPGVGGYRMPPGRTGGTGFPGSTSSTRTFPGRNPRLAELRADSNTGWESGLGSTSRTDQHAYRGDVPGANTANPRATPGVATPRGRLRELLQDTPATLAGGPMLHTGPGNDTAGANRLVQPSPVNDTQTPVVRRRVVIGQGTPGAQNVRNQVAQRYKNAPGQVHTYRSAPRGDLPTVLRNGQAGDGNVHPDEAVTSVSVPNRFVAFGGGYLSYAMLRMMPYNGRGDGARGAQLDGRRYYATGQDVQFANGGMGEYGRRRQQGAKVPTVPFTEPAPWSSSTYVTTDSIGQPESPGTDAQVPQLVYVSPSAGRAGNGTGRG